MQLLFARYYIGKVIESFNTFYTDILIFFL